MSDLLAPRLGQQRHVLSAMVGLYPYALHLRLYLALAVSTHATTRAIAQCFGARHRAGHAGRVQNALTAHLAVPHRAFDRVLDDGQQLAKHA